MDAPLTGDLSALGLGIKNSVDLAANTANKQKFVEGVTFKIVAKDDQAQPSAGQQNATALVADKSVLGVVGPLNSSVAESMQKVFDDAKLVEVSPANTNPALTQGTDWAKTKKRPYTSYFRTATTDAIQGPFAAQYVYNDAKKKKVFVIDDKKTYGAGLAATFTAEFKKLGGKVVGTQHINPTPRTSPPSPPRSRTPAPTSSTTAANTRRPARSASRSRTPAPRSRSSAATASTPRTSSSSPAAARPATSPPPSRPVEDLPSAKEFVANYKAANYKEDYAPTAATPTTPPGRSSRPSRRSSTTTAASCPTTPAPRSPPPSRTSPSTV